MCAGDETTAWMKAMSDLSALVGTLPIETLLAIVQEHGSPVYVYDERTIRERCQQLMAMPHAYGLEVSYAMKANSNRALLQIVAQQGVGVDASSLNEVRRAVAAGISPERIALTGQELAEGEDRQELESFISKGLTYNACSLLQLDRIADFAVRTRTAISVRVNPGVGSGESVTRNTGDKYSSFGIHRANIESFTALAKARGVVIGHVHAHVGSGGDPKAWQGNIDRMLSITEAHFPDATSVNLGGGFREARMPSESRADIQALGAYARQRFEEFAARTGRKLRMLVEPGTYVVANSGYLVTRVIDKKWSGKDGFEFLILDGGMESNTRPLLYGSMHPFYVVSKEGTLLSSEFDPEIARQDARVVCGKCCESGDCQTLDGQGNIKPRPMADPAVGDLVIVGGCGAYCSSMSVSNYNSYLRAPEILVREDGRVTVIRKRQSFKQLIEDEVGLDS